MECQRPKPLHTDRLKLALSRRRERNEASRLAVLNQVKDWLASKGKDYGIHQAYIFGSVVRPYHFTEQSDVDVAVDSVLSEYFFDAMAGLSEAIGREVDLVDLSKCHFAERIRQRGLLWRRTI